MTTRTTFCPACHGHKCPECDFTGKRYITVDMLVIHPDGHMDTQETTPAKAFFRIQQLVGGYVELVSEALIDPSIAATCHVCVNDEGQIQDLPINPRAVGETHCKAPLYGPVVVLPKGVLT